MVKHPQVATGSDFHVERKPAFSHTGYLPFHEDPSNFVALTLNATSGLANGTSVAACLNDSTFALDEPAANDVISFFLFFSRKHDVNCVTAHSGVVKRGSAAEKQSFVARRCYRFFVDACASIGHQLSQLRPVDSVKGLS